jgi:hypothetical protein
LRWAHRRAQNVKLGIDPGNARAETGILQFLRSGLDHGDALVSLGRIGLIR